MVIAELDDAAFGADWEGGVFDGVTLRRDLTPEDLRADRFIADMIEAVLARTPVETHVEVRQRYDHRQLAVQDGVDPSDDQDESGDSDEE